MNEMVFKVMRQSSLWLGNIGNVHILEQLAAALQAAALCE